MNKKNQKIILLTNEISRLNKQLEIKDQIINHKQEYLNKILNGKIWKIISVYFKIRDHIFTYVFKTARLDDNHVSINKFPISGLKDKISVILPVYNQAELLEKSINSILNQSYSNFEIIVVNDGSTDGIENVLDKYYQHPKIKIFSQKNQRLPAALNTGFYYAEGDYLTWTSADNISYKNQLQQLIKSLQINSDKSLVYSNYKIIDNNDLPLLNSDFRTWNQNKRKTNVIELPKVVTIQNFHESGDNFIGASFLYRSYAANCVGQYSKYSFGGEDYDYWLRMSSIFEMAHVNKVLYEYRVHNNSISSNVKKLGLDKNIKEVLITDKKRLNFLNSDIDICFNENTQNSKNKILIIDDYFLDNIKISKKNNSLNVFILKTLPSNLQNIKNFDLILTDKLDLFNSLKYLLKTSILYTAKTNIETDTQLRQILKYRLFEKVNNLNCLTIFNANKYIPSKITKLKNLAIIVDTLDKGGMEDVVAKLSLGLNEKFNIHIFVNNNKLGHIGKLLKKENIHIYLTHNKIDILKNLLIKKKIFAASIHYSNIGVLACHQLNIPSLYTMHNSYIWLNERERLEKIFALSLVDKIVCVSSEVKNFSIKYFLTDINKTVVIPNGQNAPKNLKLSISSRKNKEFTILNVARINGIKNQLNLVYAFHKFNKIHKNSKLIIAGNCDDQNYISKIYKYINQNNLQKQIEFTGYLSKESLDNIYNKSDCFVLPSIYEGWSISIMEALLHGIPIITTRTGSALDIFNKYPKVGKVIKPIFSDLSTVTFDELQETSVNIDKILIKNIYNALIDSYENNILYKEYIKNNYSDIKKYFSYDNFIKSYTDEINQLCLKNI